MADEPTRPSASDGTAEQYRSQTTLNGTGAFRKAAAFAAGAPFTAVVAAVEVAIATVVLGVRWSTAPVAVGLVAFAVYAADHVADAGADAGSTPSRARFALRYSDQLMTVAAVSYALAVALAVTAGPVALALVLVPGAVWICYAADWLPAADGRGSRLGGVTPPRLKEVFLLNSAAVALAWAVAVVGAPLGFAGSGLGPAGRPTVALFFAYVAVRSFVDVEVPNVRDVAAGLLVAIAAVGTVSTPELGALGAGLAVSLAVTAASDRLGGGLLGVAPDCSYLVAAAVLLALTG